MVDYTKTLNTSFSTARFFAVFSIVAAHLTINNSKLLSIAIGNLGSIGVIVFIVLAGYFFYPEKHSGIVAFFKTKIFSIFIPWVVCGTAVFVVTSILNNTELSVVALGKWLIGYKTYLYYLTILVLCYVIFYKKTKILCICSFPLTIISIYLTAFGIMDNIIETIHITNYLNIFNWVGYFGIGVLFQRINSEKIFKILKNTRIISVLMFLSLYTVICYYNIPTGYFSYIGIPYQLIAAWAVFSISTINMFNKKIIHSVSDMTFAIYLIHMALTGICYKIYNLSIITTLFSPVIVVLLCTIILYIGYLLFKALRLNRLYSILTGVRLGRKI